MLTDQASKLEMSQRSSSHPRISFILEGFMARITQPFSIMQIENILLLLLLLLPVRHWRAYTEDTAYTRCLPITYIAI